MTRRLRPSVRLRGFVVATLSVALAAAVVSAWPASVATATAGTSTRQSTGVLTADGAATEDGQPSQEALALARADETGHRVEVRAAATETETLWANPNGTLTLGVSETPIRVERPDGSLVHVDTTLRTTEAGLEPAATPTDVVLSDSGSGVLAQAAPTDGSASVGLGFEGRLDAPVVNGSVATYQLNPSTDVRVAATESGFAAHVLLDSAPQDAPLYRFPLHLDGVTASLAGGALVFTDAEGQVVAETSTLRMWDASTDAFGDPANVVTVDAELVNEDGRQVLELSPSMDFLTDPDTVYPVTVDPDLVLTPDEDPTIEPGTNQDGKNRSDTYVTNASGYADSSFVGDWSLRVGTPNGTDKYRSWLTFNVNPYAGLSVTKAELKLYQYGSGACELRRMDQLMATTGWNTTGSGPTRTWNRQPAVVAPDTRFASSDSFNHSGTCGSRAWESIDVTSIVSTWTGLQEPRLGMLLKTPADRELMPGWEKRFCSADPNNTGSGFCQPEDGPKKPELRVTYTPEIGDQAWYSQTEHPLNDRTTLKVNHRSGNVHLQANDVQVNGVGLDLQLARRYNSLADTPGSFGPQWSLSGGPDVWLEKVDQWRYAYHAPDGAEFGPFVRNANQSSDTRYREFTSPAGGVGADLKDNNDGTFTLTFHQSQEKYVFTASGTAGHLYMTKDMDRSDNTIRYDYVAGTTRLASITDTAGRTYQVRYNAAEQVDQITDSNGPSTRTWSYGYTNGRLSSYTDPAGNQTTYDWYTGAGSTVPTVNVITHPVNDSGQRPTTTVETSSDVATSLRFAASNSAEDSGYTFSYNVNALSPCDRTKDDRAAYVDSFSLDTGSTAYCFTNRETGDLNNNANNAKTTVIDAKGNKRSASYSPDNQSETGTSGTDATTVATYGDPSAQLGDQLQSISEPVDKDSSSGTKTAFAYDQTASFDGHKYLPVSMVDGNGDCTGYAYDGKGRLIDTWIGRTPNSNNRCDADSGSGGFHYQAAYNADGTVQWMADPNAGATSTAVDKAVSTYWQPGDAGFVAGTKGQLKTLQRPGGDCSAGASRNLCTSYTYDGLSRTDTMTDGRNKVTKYSYDTLDRTRRVLINGATSCDHAAGTCVTYDYDAEGNLTQRVDALGTTTFDYDRLNRQIRQHTPDGVQVAYAYTLEGNVATLQQTVPGQPTDTTQYFYDGAAQLSSVQDAAGEITITRDGHNRLDVTRFPTSPVVTIDRDYTNAGRPMAIYVQSGLPENDGLTDYKYTWTKQNSDGTRKDTNQLQKYEVLSPTAAINYQATYDYNGRGQLVSDTRSNGGGPSFNYAYDAAGNLASKTTDGATTHYGYDKAGQLCWKGPSTGSTPVTSCPSAAPGSNTLIQRDAAGNSEGSPAKPIQYNAYNQAARISGQDQAYLDLGNDLRIQAGATRLINTRFGITARTTSSGTTYYTRMPDGRLLASHGAGGTHFYVTDYQKSVVAISGTDGQRAGTYRYAPYGEPTLVEATGAAQSNPFRWHGGYHGIEGDGYYKFGARYYDADGHFTQPDPEPGDMTDPLRLNSYTYAACDPINAADPSGRSACDFLLSFSLTSGAASLVLAYASFTATGTIVGAPAGLVLGAASVSFGAGSLAAGLLDAIFC